MFIVNFLMVLAGAGMERIAHSFMKKIKHTSRILNMIFVGISILNMDAQSHIVGGIIKCAP